MILNGYYLRETYKMDFMGMPFEGELTAGYDSIRKKHVSVWVDNMSPVPYVSYGNMKEGKLVLMGKGPDMAGQMEGKKMVLGDGNADTWTVTFYDIKADGTEHLSMQLKYTRKAK